MPDRPETPLIGRAPELARLREAIADPPAVCVVEGEAGIGKTRVVQELLADVAPKDAAVLVGACHPLAEPFPLGGVVEALRRAGPAISGAPLDPVAGALRPLLPEIASLLPHEPAGSTDPAGRRHLRFRAVREVLDAASPVVLVLEDLHWADRETADLVAFLAARPPDGLRLVATFRREGLEPPLLRLLRPAPGVRGCHAPLRTLDHEATAKLAAELLGGSLADDAAARLHERTSGLPFLVVELVAYHRDRGEMVLRDGRWRCADDTSCREGVPPALADMVEAHLGELGGDAGRVVRAASVLGGPVDPAIAIAVAGLPGKRGLAAIEEAKARGFLESAPDGAFSFRHALVRESIAAALREPARRRVHERAARAIRETGGPWGRVAHHQREAGATSAWVRAAERGAGEALAAGEDRQAATLLRPLLDLTLPRATRIRLAGMLGRAALHGLAHDEAIEVLEGILRRERLTPGVRGEIRLSLARLRVQAGDAAGQHAEATRAVADLTRRPDLQIQAMASLASPFAPGTRREMHEGWARRAEAIAPRVRDPAALRRARDDIVMSRLAMGDPSALRAIEEGPPAERTLDEVRDRARAASNLARSAMYVGRYELAEAQLKEAERLAVEPALVRLRGYVGINRALLDFYLGRWAGLGERVEELSEEYADLVHVVAEGELIGVLLGVARGESPDAAERLERIGPVLGRIGSEPLQMVAMAGLGRLRLAYGDTRGAIAVAESSMTRIREKGIWSWAGEAVVGAVNVHLRTGAAGEADTIASEAEEHLRDRGSPLLEASTLSCRALIAHSRGDARAAAEWSERAGRAWGRLPRPLSAAMCLGLLGEAVIRTDPALGERHLRDALSAFRAMGAKWEADWISRHLRDAGVEVPTRWRGGRRGYGNELSPRETEVVRLVASGLTNRRIAEALYLSPRTVGHHVSRAMGKLGVSSRAALAVAALERAKD